MNLLPVFAPQFNIEFFSRRTTSSPSMTYTFGTRPPDRRPIIEARPKDNGTMSSRKKLGEILVDLKVLRPADVERVLHALDRRFDRQKFGEVARNMGLVNEEHILA